MMEEGHHFLTDILTTGAILLGAALVAVLVFRRLGLGAVLGYLVAGIVIGRKSMLFMLIFFRFSRER